MVHVPLMFLSEWREFPSPLCLAGKRMITPHGKNVFYYEMFKQ
jgi:hypothetical protein